MTTIHKAQPMGGRVAPDLHVEAVEEMHTDGKAADWQARNRAIFRSDADAIVEALYRSLPGGTVDQVLRLLLEHKASDLVVVP